MKLIAIRETREEREQRKAHALLDSVFIIYYFHKPDGLRFEPTLQHILALPKGITKLGQELP